MNPTRIAVLLLLFVVAAHSVVQAQQKKKMVGSSTPLAPDEKPTSMWLGGYIGPTFSSQGGTFRTNCNCEFTGGAGVGFLAGLMFEKVTTAKITFGGMLGYDSRGLTGRFHEIEGSDQTSPSGKTYTVPIKFLNEATMSIDVLSFTGYAKYAFAGPVFAKLGASAGYAFSSNLKHTKTLETKSVTFPNGEVATVTMPNSVGGVYTVQDEAVKDLNPLQLGVIGAIGVEIPIRRVERKFGPPAVSTYLSPVIQYQFPLTTISAQGTNFNLRQMQVFLELRHNL